MMCQKKFNRATNNIIRSFNNEYKYSKEKQSKYDKNILFAEITTLMKLSYINQNQSDRIFLTSFFFFSLIFCSHLPSFLSFLPLPLDSLFSFPITLSSLLPISATSPYLLCANLKLLAK